MKKSLGRKTAALFMAAIMGVASSVCTPSMAVKAESATVTDAEEEIVDVQEEQVEQTEQTAEDEELIDIEVMAGDVPIDSAHFPDENFRNYVSGKFDKDSNGVLSDNEINEIKRVFVPCKQIKSLQGIEFFTELEGLNCEHNGLSSLDISNNKKLKWLCCDGNKLNILDVSNNLKLTSISCENNNIRSLDVSNFPLLESLHCGYNLLENLNVSNNTLLEELWCSGNKLNNLNVKNNVLLKSLVCIDDNLNELDVSNASSLIELICCGNKLCSLDVSKNPMLKILNCGENNLNKLDVSNNSLLEGLNVSFNKLKNIDISNNYSLAWFCCSCNELDAIDLSNNIELSELECYGNNFEKIDISKNKKIYLYCDERVIQNLNFTDINNIGAIRIHIMLNESMQYNLSRIPWLQINKIDNVSFAYYDNIIDEFYQKVDESSYLSDNIINIVNHDLGCFYFQYDGINIRFEYSYVPLKEEDINPGIFVLTADKDHYVAGVATTCSEEDKARLEYSWVAQDPNGNFIQISDWSKSEWVNWKPEKYGLYTIFAKVRLGKKDDYVYTTVGQYDYHPYIKGKCQLPYSVVAPGQPGYLIGVESYENPNQSYQFEMLILDCTLLAQGLPAWTYTTGKFTVPEGNAGWCVWNPQYGYYWTLFRIYDGAGNLIDEYCYPFVNAY